MEAARAGTPCCGGASINCGSGSLVQGAVEQSCKTCRGRSFGVSAILGGSALIPPTAAAGGVCAAVTAGWCIPLGGSALALEAATVAAGVLVTGHGVGVLANNITQPLQFSRSGSGRTSSQIK